MSHAPVLPPTLDSFYVTNFENESYKAQVYFQDVEKEETDEYQARIIFW